MRCLQCHQDGVPTAAVVCPSCGVHLPSLLRDLLVPGTILCGGMYRIDYALGQGGFGITYRAMNIALEQVVAIKEFYPQEFVHRDSDARNVTVAPAHQETFTKGLGRFLREGRTLAKLNHPGVVRVLNLFEERGTAYLVMELLGGRTLRAELNAQADHFLPSERITAITGQLVEALAVVHAAGITHLDVKPDNIILTPDQHAILIDFGACKQDGAVNTHSSTRAFTLEYAPPELVAGMEIGPESDLFELGMTLHEMLTGALPPSGISRVLHDNWAPTGLDDHWRQLLVNALKVKKQERPVDIRAWWAGTMTPSPVSKPLAVPPVNAYDVVLTGFDPAKKINVIKVVRELTGMGLKEAKDLVESAPQPVAQAVDHPTAIHMQRALETGGARVELPHAATMQPAAYEAQPTAPSGADVVLVAFQPSMKINVIKLIREITGFGLKEAKDLVEGTPQRVCRDVPLSEALEMQRYLEEGGGYVELRAAVDGTVIRPPRTAASLPAPPVERTTPKPEPVIEIPFEHERAPRVAAKSPEPLIEIPFEKERPLHPKTRSSEPEIIVPFDEERAAYRKAAARKVPLAPPPATIRKADQPENVSGPVNAGILLGGILICIALFLAVYFQVGKTSGSDSAIYLFFLWLYCQTCGVVFGRLRTSIRPIDRFLRAAGILLLMIACPLFALIAYSYAAAYQAKSAGLFLALTYISAFAGTFIGVYFITVKAARAK